MKDTTISFLFKQRKISEETYFYCFLNKINNISEIDINSIPKTLTCVYNELSEMFTCDDKEQFYNNIKNNIASNCNKTSTEVFNKEGGLSDIKLIYDKAIQGLSGRATNQFNVLRRHFTTDYELYYFLLQFTDGLAIDNIKGIGEKTQHELKLVALKYRNLLGNTVLYEMEKHRTQKKHHEKAAFLGKDIWKDLRYLLEEAQKNVDINTRICLSYIRYKYPKDEEFYSYIFRFNDENVLPEISKRINKETILQIISIANELREYTRQYFTTYLPGNNLYCINWKILWRFIQPVINEMSDMNRFIVSRLLNGIASFSNVTDIDIFIRETKETDIHSYNSNNRLELNMLYCIIKNLISVQINILRVEDLILIDKLKWIAEDMISPSKSENIGNIKNKLGYFPVFKAIEAYISSMSYKRRNILLGLVNIYENQIFKTEKELSIFFYSSLKNIVDIRTSAINNIKKYVETLIEKDYIDLSYYTIDRVKHINEKEETIFSETFISWILCLINNDKEQTIYLRDRLLNNKKLENI